ncbi:SapC family protein [Agaribacter flavus]|uniref:SapC family protein n=1 Tax=Agaribacter flavus TaxID=1902781 RepID=A0ABV7FPI5_9ALTE
MQKESVELLDNIRHKDVTVDNNLFDIPANHVNTVYIVMTELANLVHEYPIFITKQPNSEAFGLNALLGLHPGENLYLQNGQWDARYLPLDILRKPFQAVLAKQDDFSQGNIAIDLSSPQVTSKKGEALYDESGQATPYLERIKQTFTQLMGAMDYTNKRLQRMAELGLIQAITLQFDDISGEKTSLNGLHSINKDALAALSGSELEEAHKDGILQICHLIMSSGAHVQKLINWSKQKEQVK